MTDEFIPFARPDITEEEIAAVSDALRSGWLTSGSKVEQFEKEFVCYLGGGGSPNSDDSLELRAHEAKSPTNSFSNSFNDSFDEESPKEESQKESQKEESKNFSMPLQAVAVNSATAGLHLALEALGLGPGDEVLLPVMTFTATAEVVVHCGATPVFVDVNESDLNISLADLAAKVNTRSKAVIVVHYGGQAADMDAILSLADKHGLFVVEDAAHALPTEYKGRLVGTLASDATVFSFYATKTMTTGEGGMVVTRNGSIAERIRLMRLHGINRHTYAREKENSPWHYDVVDAGYKYNMPDTAAALGLVQLERLDHMQQKRESLAARYQEALSGQPLASWIKPIGRTSSCTRHSRYLFTVKLRAAHERERLLQYMRGNKIQLSLHFWPLHLQPYWQKQYSLKEKDFPVAQGLATRIFSLPLYSAMPPEHIEQVARALVSFFDQGG